MHAVTFTLLLFGSNPNKIRLDVGKALGRNTALWKMGNLKAIPVSSASTITQGRKARPQESHCSNSKSRVPHCLLDSPQASAAEISLAFSSGKVDRDVRASAYC
ncbi:hypothetical protein BDW59DRAFT_144293 [Aspergillus cavernicola]|uniref:Uncharacterized protein n=1 Tax=Aspergillus cavernicola TaxID=176166 RepID=A0ABR4IKL6_9EURO